MNLPSAFCWTKYGDEAGEAVASILRRKEAERSANGGLFLWGIGTSIRPSLLKLLTDVPNPDVIFSPMLSSPAARDVSPTAVVVWQRARGLDGESFDLPTHTTVTSRLRTSVGAPRHYALVCESSHPITTEDNGTVEKFLDDRQLRNIASGRPIGASQVTSVVRVATTRNLSQPRYRVGFRATLRHPYLVQLLDCTNVDSR